MSGNSSSKSVQAYEFSQFFSNENNNASPQEIWNEIWSQPNDIETLPIKRNNPGAFLTQSMLDPVQRLASPMSFSYQASEPQSTSLTPYVSSLAADSDPERDRRITSDPQRPKTSSILAAQKPLLPKKRNRVHFNDDATNDIPLTQAKRQLTARKAKKPRKHDDKQGDLNLESLEQQASRFMERVRARDAERIKLEQEAILLKTELEGVKARIVEFEAVINTLAEESDQSGTVVLERLRRVMKP